MKKCLTCNLTYEDSSRFCSRCGGGLVMEQVAGGVPFQTGSGRDMAYAQQGSSGAAVLIAQALQLQVKGSVGQACRLLEKGAEAYPGDIELRQRLVALLVQSRKFLQAIRHLQVLVSHCPDMMSAWLLLVEALIASGREDSVPDLLRRAAAIDCRDNQIVRLKDLLMRQKMYPEALSVSKRIVSIWPEDISAWKDLAICSWRLGESDVELDAWQRVLKVTPGDAMASLRAGLICAVTGKASPQECVNLLERAVADEHGGLDEIDVIQARAVLAGFLAAGGRVNQAIGVLKSIAPPDAGEHPELLQLLARKWLEAANVLRAEGQWESAHEAYGNARDLGLRNDAREGLVETCLALAANASGVGMTAAAAAYACEAADSSDDPELHARAAGLCMDCADELEARGDHQGALRFLRIAGSLSGSRDEAVRGRLRSVESALATGRIRKLAVFFAALVLVAAGAGAFLLAKGDVQIKVKDAVRVSLLDDGVQIKSVEGDSLSVEGLRTGRYTVKAESSLACFEPMEKVIWSPFGLGLSVHDFKLKRVTGTVSVGTLPAGATLTVKNPVEEKSCTTPCRLQNLLAIESDITVSLGEMTPVTMRETIPANGVLLPGFISFKGEVEVVTIPEGAVATLGGRESITTPGRFRGLLPMGQTLKVEKPGYITQYSDQSVVDGQLTKVRVELVPRYGTVVVNGRLPDGSACKGNVTIDGIQVGNTGNSFQTLAKETTIGVECEKGAGSVNGFVVKENEKKFVSVKVSPLEWAQSRGLLKVVNRTAWQYGGMAICQDWFSADIYCQDLMHAHYLDWRLPSRREMIELEDSGEFVNLLIPGEYYWSEAASDWEAVAYKVGGQGKGRREVVEKGSVQLCNIVCARTLGADEGIPPTPPVGN